MPELLARKLAVILHADVVNSTALVHRHEERAHENIQAAFGRLSRTIETYQGKTHELRGDALVAEFERVSDAVSAALAFQTANTNAIADDDVQPQLRMGISMGEVVIADHTVTGPGVVLAQRLEQLSEPSGVCLQGAAYETLPKRLPYEFQSLGECDVKGFEDPVRAYAVSLKSGEVVPAPDARADLREAGRKSPTRWWIAAAVVGIVIVVGGALARWQPWVEQAGPTSGERLAGSQTNNPSIAVLPFDNLSGDVEQQYFSDGMTDDLITDLSKVAGLTVIARTSTFAYRGKPDDIRKIAQMLDAHYVVEGSVRRASNTVRINAQLIDAQTGLHVWAERYDATIDDIFSLQDRITRQIVDALAVEVSSADLDRVTKRDTNDLQAYDVFLQGSETFQRFSRDDTFLAREHFEEALALDPAFARAYAMLAWTYVFEYTNGWSRTPQETLQRSLDLANKSISLNGRLPVAYFVKGLVHRERREYVEALAEAQRAIEIDSNYANGHVLLATILYYAGRAEEGLRLLNKASRLNPHHPSNYPFHRGQALFILERYEQAIEAFENGLTQNPTSQRLRVWLAASYVQAGRLDDAEWEASEILTTDPEFSPSHLIEIFPFQDPDDLERFNGALRRAGFEKVVEREHG